MANPDTQSLKQASDGIQGKVADFGRAATAAVEDGREMLDAGNQRLHVEIDHIKAGINTVLEQLMERGDSSVKAVTATVTNRPILSVCGAFAAGWIVAMILGGRRSS